MTIFFLVLLHVYSDITIGAASTTPGKVCLTWKIKRDGHLILRCKTENFDYSISFYDPVGIETAFCTPKTCLPLNKVTSLFQNKTTKETFLTIPLGTDAEKFNGWWVCRYGRSNGKAKVEITLSTKFTVVGKEENSCEMLTILSFVVWLTVGFLAIQLIALIATTAAYLLKGIQCIKQRMHKRFRCLGQCAKVVVPVIQGLVAIIIILVMIVSYIRTQDEICYDPVSSTPLIMMIIPISIGIFFGVVYFFLNQIKDDFEPNSIRNEEDTPSNGDREMEEILPNN